MEPEMKLDPQEVACDEFVERWSAMNADLLDRTGMVADPRRIHLLRAAMAGAFQGGIAWREGAR
jgi:hypothetical protein